ncbi:MAG: beta strand repeat-containing protein [Phycisphaerae bacterium]
MSPRLWSFGTPAHYLLAAAALSACTLPATGASYVWNSGAAGSWGTVTNWTPNGTPGLTDSATINNGNPVLDTNPAIQSLFWSGGTLNTGNLSVSSIINFTGGNDALSAAILTNGANATATLTTGNILFANASQLVNNGAFTVNAGSIGNNGGAASLVTNNNAFTVNLLTSTSTFTINVPFSNAANVTVQNGILDLAAGDGGSTAGIFNLAANGSVHFRAGTFNLGASSTISGTGTATFNGANLSLGANNLSFASPVSLTAGLLTGTGAATFNNAFNWTSGTISVDTTLNANSSFAGGSLILSAANLTNAANSSISHSAGNLLLSNAAIFNNAGNYTATAGSIGNNGGSTSQFNNSGNFTLNLLNPVTAFTVGVPFANSGNVSVLSGNLTFNAGDGGSTTGNFSLGASGALSFHTGTFNLASSISISGAGIANLNGATINTGANNISFATPVVLSAGLISGSGNVTFNGPLTWTNGTISVDSITAGNLTLTGGTLALQAANLTTTAGKTVSLTAGNLQLSTAALFTNNSNFTVTGGNIIVGSGATSLFTNAANFNVNLLTPSSTFSSSVPFNNTANVSVTNGIMTLSAGDGGSTTGNFSLLPGGTLNLTGGTFTLATSASISGTGTAKVAGATLTVGSNAISIDAPLTLASGSITGSGNLSLNGGFTWTSGTLSTDTTLHGNSTFTGGNLILLASNLTNSANNTITQTAGNLLLGTAALFTNNGAYVATNGGIGSNGGAASLFTNNGSFTLNHVNSASTFTVSIPFNNAGNISVTSGTLDFSAGDGGSTTGNFNIVAGAVNFRGGTFNLASSVSIAGAGNLNLDGSTVSIGNNPVTVAAPVNLSSGTITGTGSLTLNGPLTWTGGTITAPVVANANVTLAGGNLILQSASFSSAAGKIVALNTGNLLLSTGAHFTNNSNFTAIAGSIGTGGGAASLFTNNGSFNLNLTNSAGTFTVSTPFANAGAVNVQSGTLTLSTGDNGSTTGSFSLGTSTTLNLNSAFTFSGANASVSGPGTLLINGNTTMARGIVVNSLTVNKSLQITSNGATSGTSSVTSLTIPGNNTPSVPFDLTNNRLIVEPAASKATVLATLQAQVAYGKTHSTGIRSTTLPANMGLAVFDNGARAIPFSSFGGLPADTGSILIGPELLGDANIDGRVDLTDLSTILNNFGTTTFAWTSGNFDGAATIGLTDLSDVLNNFGTSNPTPNVSPALAVPEPTTALLLLPATCLLLSRRKTRTNI